MGGHVFTSMGGGYPPVGRDGARGRLDEIPEALDRSSGAGMLRILFSTNNAIVSSVVVCITSSRVGSLFNSY